MTYLLPYCRSYYVFFWQAVRLRRCEDEVEWVRAVARSQRGRVGWEGPDARHFEQLRRQRADDLLLRALALRPGGKLDEGDALRDGRRAGDQEVEIGRGSCRETV